MEIKSRIPVRPLSNENWTKGFKNEIIADYRKNQVQLFVIDETGEKVNVTASAASIIDQLVQMLIKDPTILSNVQVEMPPEGSGVVVSVDQAIREMYQYYDEMNTSINNYMTSTNTIINNHKTEVSNQIKQINKDIDKIEQDIANIFGQDPETIKDLTELATWVKNHGGDAASMTSAIETNTTNIATNKSNITKLTTRVKTLEDGMSDYIKKSQIVVSTSTFNKNNIGSDKLIYIQVE